MDKAASSENNKIILIVDKEGFIGNGICKKISPNIPSVYITSNENPIHNSVPENSLLLPFKKRIPRIPAYSYSHIFVIFNNEKEITDVLSHFIKQAEKLKSKLIFLIPYISGADVLAKHVTDSYKNTTIMFFGDYFDENTPRIKSSLINRFLLEAMAHGKITAFGLETEKTNLVYLTDLTDSVLEVSLSEKQKSKYYFLFPKNSPTQLSIIRMFQRIDPFLRVDFKNEKINIFKTSKKIDIPEDSVYLFDDDYPVEKRLKETMQKKEIKPRSDTSIVNNHDRKKKHGKKHRPNLFLYLLYLLIIVFLLPFLSTALFFFLGVFQLNFAKDAIYKSNYVRAKVASKSAKQLFSFAQTTSEVIQFTFLLIGKKNWLDPVTVSIRSGEEISDTVYSAIEGMSKFEDVVSGKSMNPKSDFISAIDTFENATGLVQKIQLEKNSNFFAGVLPANKIKEFDDAIKLFTSTKDTYLKIFGFEGKKTYLVLFQNNMELRPGGGFIGSYGILVLENGKVLDFTIHDVYEADGQLKGHVEPAFPIRRYIPLVHLYLRDSNFDVDFSKNGYMAALMLNRETGQVVDGVIGVDVSFVKNALSVLGPIYVSDYKETVTDNNLYMLTQTKAEKNFFPGSTQKQDFLRSLFNSIQNKIAAENSLPYLNFVNIIAKSVYEKHLIFVFSDNITQNIFTINDLSSSLWDNRENNGQTINDFLGINEANLGVNKANYFIKRKIDQTIAIDKSGVVNGNVEIKYRNLSKAGEWPGGDYKNYLRIILPFGAELVSVFIDGQEQKIVPAVTDFLIYENKNFRPPSGLEVEKSIEDNKTIYGFLTVVPTDSYKTVKIRYKYSNLGISSENAFVYSLKVFKQPGTDEDPYLLNLTYPDNFQVIDTSFGVRKNQNTITFSRPLLRDINFKANLALR
ncbi:MAG: DUF4012 domain-containing protein [Patescibacteria group bacterium]|nr:DUF4012 domain-containing protein [Patescibacteria group bacterium]